MSFAAAVSRVAQRLAQSMTSSFSRGAAQRSCSSASASAGPRHSAACEALESHREHVMRARRIARITGVVDWGSPANAVAGRQAFSAQGWADAYI